MRDDDDGSPILGPRCGIARLTGTVALLAGLGLAVRPGAAAESFHGSAEVQYQNIERTRAVPNQDFWSKILQLDYANGLPGSIEFTSSLRFVEQTVPHQSARVRVPEGSVRLAHRNFGLSTAYRPTETRDSRDFIVRQQDLTVMGYARAAALPTLAGSWVRSHFDANALSPGSATVTRSLSSQYTVPHATFRAGYGDRFIEEVASANPRIAENHVSLGTTTQFQLGRAPISFQYDFSQARAYASRDESQQSRAHVASTGTTLSLGPRTSTSFSYNYRQAQIVGVPRSVTQEHNGGVTLSHILNPVVLLSGGAGIRSAILSGHDEIERFVTGTASAQGQARPGWRLSAAATQSVNWLPDDAARPAANLQATTSMRLAPGLEARGDFSIATARPFLADTTSALRQVTVQNNVGLAAIPLRSIYLDVSMSRSRTGTSLLSPTVTSNSYSTGLRLTPNQALQVSGRWGLVESPGSSKGTTEQAALQWTVVPALQLSGLYNHSRQESFFLAPRFVSVQESFAGSMTVRLVDGLNATLQYSESNRHQPSHIQQLIAHVVTTFGN